MELKVSAEKPGFSSSDGTTDPEKEEISEGEDEDDDRNHKHRKREERSQLLEGNSSGNGCERPYRKRNRQFQNDYFAPERNFGPKRLNAGPFSSMPSDFSQRFRGNHPFPIKLGSERGRGMEPFPWGMHDPRLGLANVSSQGTSWASYGMIPGAPGGVLDPSHSLSLQSALGPPFSAQMNIGIPRQRCRDFEERGFCLRGDMCPMEHGINRIVVDDFQSLSQFNLPVSAPGSQVMGASSGQGVPPRLGPSSGNSKAFYTNVGDPGVANSGFGLNGVLGASLPVTSDLYDPDQPLLNNENPETSAALFAANQRNLDGECSFTDADISSGKNIGSSYGDLNNELSLAAGSQSSSVRGRMRNPKQSLEVNASAGRKSPSFLKKNGKTEAMGRLLPDIPHQVLLPNIDGNGLPASESSYKVPNDRKPSQKAVRTLFVNGVPPKDNKREALLSHFQKFGDVIDIYIPMNGERAFVQFSKREEAEMALKSPDAVMGNRFIKLWWANRDNIPGDLKQGVTAVMSPYGTMSNPSSSHSLVLDKRKENPNSQDGKNGSALGPAVQSSANNRQKPLVANISKSPSLQKKKSENLELLKEELRKKQQMLDHKRNEFKRELDRLEKKAVGTKNGTISDQPKGSESEMSACPPKAEIVESSVRDDVTVDKVSPEHTEPPVSDTCPAAPEPETLISPSRPLSQGSSFAINRFKLDNRPTSFRIISPLPSGLAKIEALEEHFSSFSGLSSVELEGPKPMLEDANDAPISSGVSARVTFTARHFAEKAFSHGKLWKGQKLQFSWLAPARSSKEGVGCTNPSSSSDPATCASSDQPEPVCEVAQTIPNKIETPETGVYEPLITEVHEGSAEKDSPDKNDRLEGVQTGNNDAES